MRVPRRRQVVFFIREGKDLVLVKARPPGSLCTSFRAVDVIVAVFSAIANTCSAYVFMPAGHESRGDGKCHASLAVLVHRHQFRAPNLVHLPSGLRLSPIRILSELYPSLVRPSSPRPPLARHLPDTCATLVRTRKPSTCRRRGSGVELRQEEGEKARERRAAPGQRCLFMRPLSRVVG